MYIEEFNKHFLYNHFVLKSFVSIEVRIQREEGFSMNKSLALIENLPQV